MRYDGLRDAEKDVFLTVMDNILDTYQRCRDSTVAKSGKTSVLP